MSHLKVYPYALPRKPPARCSHPLNELLAAIHTVNVSATSVFCIFFLAADLLGNLAIQPLAAHRTTLHRCVWTPMVEVGTATVARYHLYAPSLSLPF